MSISKMHGKIFFRRTIFQIPPVSRKILNNSGNNRNLTSTDCDDTKNRKKPQFGSRYLIPNRVFDFNAWDNVAWDEEQEQTALTKVSQNSKTRVPTARVDELEENAGKYWESFYGIHQNRFFKDRNWLFTEFPELDPSSEKPISVNALNADTQKRDLTIYEIGCGVGNTIFPILRQVAPEGKTFVYGSDFSESAIKILKEHPNYDPSRCCAFVCDATADDWRAPFAENSLDIVVLIFALSAINPEKFSHVVKKIFAFLAPGGLVLFRDYGRFDLAQLRFKDGQCLDDNFYVRGDGTRVYFFTQDDMKKLFTEAGFVEEQNVVDRRLQVNRGKMLKMYRVWVQGKYRKPK